jgi:hypothetical protein
MQNMDHSNTGLEGKFSITTFNKRERLIPVITFVNGLSSRNAVCAWLSFLSECHKALYESIRHTGILDSINETVCRSILDEVIRNYLNIKMLPVSLQIMAIDTAHKIITTQSPENHDFLKTKFIQICGEKPFSIYWKKLENLSCFEDFSKVIDLSFSSMQTKYFADFSIFLISLAVLYGCGDEYYKQLLTYEENLELKYDDSFPFRKLSLCLWPLDFSFVETDCGVNKEHPALLEAIRKINGEIKIQVCADSLNWSRDVIAWLDNDHNLFVHPDLRNDNEKFGRGLLSEGGNIVTGKAKTRFIILATSPLSDMMDKIDFYHEMFEHDIYTYILPDGFLYARNSATGEDVILDSIHIDTVINIIPGEFTNDNKPKILVDPLYHSIIKNDPSFIKLLQEQSIPEQDIIIVDESERYLNLPNFAIFPDPTGKRALLFNKDKGLTLPRLNLKNGLLVQPEIEIVNMAAYYGLIRCATNMLPELLISKCKCPSIDISQNFQPGMSLHIKEMLESSDLVNKEAPEVWITNIRIDAAEREMDPEFDEFSRTAFLYLAPDQICSKEKIAKILDEQLSEIIYSLRVTLGIVLPTSTQAPQ